jgi:hypothetical protein
MTSGKAKKKRQMQMPITRKDQRLPLKTKRFSKKHVMLVAERTTDNRMPRSFLFTTSTWPFEAG